MIVRAGYAPDAAHEHLGGMTRMLVELGNSAPKGTDVRGPGVTYIEIPPGYSYKPADDGVALEVGSDILTVESAADLAKALQLHHAQALMRNDGITHAPDQEAFWAVAHSGGAWAAAASGAPDWVHCDNPDFATLLGAHFDCPVGKPPWVEDRYWTQHGNRLLAPGVIPAAAFPPVATKTDAGRDLMWAEGIGFAAGTTGTSTATAAASMTDSGASWGTTQYVGRMVICANRYANIISHTGTILTLDRWYDITTPGGTAGSTPGSTSTYIIMNTAPPSQFMGLTANASAVGTGDTTLPSEITTVGGGLIRKLGTLTHTAGASTGTVVGVFTANGTDSLPVTIAKMGISPSLLSTVNNLFQTLLNATATLAVSGDQLTITDTITD